MSRGTDAPAARQAPDLERILSVPFVTLMVSNGLLRICSSMLIVLVPLYVLGRGMSALGAGLTTTVYMLAAVATRPTGGRLVDTRGRYIVMIVGALLYWFAGGTYILTLPVWGLLVFRAVQGVGFSFNGTAVMTVATDIIPEGRLAQGIGILGMEQTVAQLFAPWLALELRSEYGYTAAFAVAFGLSGANILARFPLRARLIRVDRERREARARADAAASAAHESAGTGCAPGGSRARPPRWQRVVEKDAWRPALVVFLVMAGTTGVNTYLAAYAIERGIANAGLFFTGSGVMLGVSRLVLGPVQRRVGIAPAVTVGLVLVALALLGVFWTPSLLVLALAGACFGAGMGLVQPTLNALAVLVADREARGMANATFFMAMDSAQAVSAVLLGLLADAAGLGSVFPVGAAVVAVAAVAFVILHRRGLLRTR